MRSLSKVFLQVKGLA
jgi:IS30 family transposase